MSELVPEALLPHIAIAAFTASVAGAAALANCAVVVALFTHTRNGLFAIIVQLAIADILLAASIVPELWSDNARTWLFGSISCTFYQGISIFASTASLYLVIAIILHALTTINIEEKSTKRRINRPTRDEDEEMRSSQHSLVASSDSSTPPRTMNVDYRLAVKRVAVTLPTVFVWVLSASLSVPEFALASNNSLKNGVVVCALDLNHRLIVHSLLAIFILFVPLFIMSTVSSLIMFKLRSKISSEIEDSESVQALKLSLWLVIVYAVLCAPRSIISVYRVYSASMSDTEPYSNLSQQSDVSTLISLAISGADLVSTLIRPLLCIIILPRIRSIFTFTCSKNAADV